MKVITTNEFQENKVPLMETGIIYEEGKVIEISEERFEQLGTTNNAFHKIFVLPYKEEKKVEVAKKEEVKETAVKKTRKKTK